MDKKIKKIALLGVSLESSNMGVQALAHGALKMLREVQPNSEIIILDYGYEASTYKVRTHDGEYTTQVVNLRFSKKLYLPNNIALLIFLSLLIRLVPLKSFKRFLKRQNKYLQLIDEVSLCAALSGGDSFSDIYGLPRLAYVALPQILCLLLKKNLLILPQTIGPFRFRCSKSVAGWILKRATFVFSRDEESLKRIQNDYPDMERSGKLRFCHDLGFLMDAIDPTEIPAPLNQNPPCDRNIIGFNISGLLYSGGYTGDNAFNLLIDYQSFVLELIDFLISECSATVVLIPHVLGKDPTSESDWVFCRAVYEEIKSKYPGKLFFLEQDYDQHEIKALIGKCSFFIGSRMHSCIAALSQCVPALAVAYSRKFRGVYKSIGVEELVADPRKLNSREIIDVVWTALRDKDKLMTKLDNVIPLLSDEIGRAFSFLKQDSEQSTPKP